MRMRRTKTKLLPIICLMLVIKLQLASGISTSKVKEIEAIESAKDLKSPSPSPSPSTTSEFSSRRGTTTTTTTTKGVKKPKFIERKENSTDETSASTTNSQITFPSAEEENKSQEGVEVGGGGVELHLLEDSKEHDDHSNSKKGHFEGEGRSSKFPRIYYGEASPPYHGQQLEDHLGLDGKKHLESNNALEENPKYFYPKDYVHNKGHGVKGGKKHKKRFEYKYDPSEHNPTSSPQSQSQQEQNGGGNYHLGGQHLDFNPEDHEGKSHDQGIEADGHHGHDFSHGHHGYGEFDGHHFGHYPHGHYGVGRGHHYMHGADLIGKALQVLIPSALLLTGVSALFPNRLHVPTNDNRPSENHQNVHRHKRSIGYGHGGGDFLHPEHRSIDDPSGQGYDFGLQDFRPVPMSREEFSASQLQNGFIPTTNEFTSQSSKHLSIDGLYGQKSSSVNSNSLNLKYIEPSTPQEYDRFHFGPQTYDFIIPDSSYEPASPIPTLLAPTPSPKPKRRVRQRVNIKVRQGKRQRSKPLPSPSQPSHAHIAHVQDNQLVNELQALFEPEKAQFANYVQSPVPTLASTSTPQSHHDVNEKDEITKILSAIQANRQQMESQVRNLAENVDTSTTMEVPKEVDLSPDGPVMGLITSYAQHDRDSPACQKKALCELAIKGKSPSSTKFETFLWSLASLVPDQFSKMYDLDEIFKAIKSGGCDAFQCMSPNLDLQV